jgi:hypothetical protein
MTPIKNAPNSHGWVPAKHVEELWRDRFGYFYREFDDFIFQRPFTQMSAVILM